MIAAFFAGFAFGALTLVIVSVLVGAHEERRPWLDEQAFRAERRSLSARRRAIRRGIAAAGPMPVGGCSDEQWN